MELLLAVAIAIVLSTAALVRWAPPATVADLRPRPDALEYEETARNLVAGRGYGLVFDGGRYPSRYPPGFSLLLTPSVWLAGGGPGSGIWTVLGSAVVAVAAAIVLGARAAGPIAGLGAGTLLALLPLHIAWSQTVMSDVTASALVGALALWAMAALERSQPRRLEWAMFGLVLGLTTAVRQSCVLLGAPIVVLLAYGNAWWAAAALVAGAAVGLGPLLGYQLVTFGSPLADGYGYWHTFAHHAWQYVLGPPAAGGDEPNLLFYLKELLGLGRLYIVPTALLIVLGTVEAVRRPGPHRVLAVLAGGYLAALLCLYVPFYWQWDRFLLPATPLLMALAAVPLGAATATSWRLAAAALLAITLGAILRAPHAFWPPDAATMEASWLAAIAGRVEPNAALLARSNVFFMERMFHAGTDRVWLPLGLCQHRALVRAHHLTPAGPAGDPDRAWIREAFVEPFDRDQAVATLRGLLAEGRPVYLSTMLMFEVPFANELRVLLQQHFVIEPLRETPSLARIRLRTPSDR